MHTALMPMKRITFTASEALYRQLSLQSNLMKKSTSELIRECVEEKMAEKRQAAMLTQKKTIAGLINWSKQFLKENPEGIFPEVTNLADLSQAIDQELYGR